MTTTTTTSTTTDLATDYADSFAAMVEARCEAGAPFGHVNELDEWHDVDECPADCEQREASAYDYLSDALDIHYVVNGDHAYRAARVCVGFGGPNVWIDTTRNEVQVSWGWDYAARSLHGAFINALNDALAELWETGA